MNLEKRRQYMGLAYTAPAFILHGLVITLPFLSLFYYSLTDWNGLEVRGFVGMDNFVRAFTLDSNFISAIVNTLEWTLFFMIVPVFIGLIVALGVVRMRRSQMLMRSLLFLPYVIAAVVVGDVFTSFYSPYSGLAKWFKIIGFSSLANFAPLADPKLAIFFVAFADCWHWWGFVMVMFLAALHQVDAQLYEASDLEGATSWQKLRHVTIPSIMPTIVTLYMTIIIGSFLTFDYVYVMTNGGPGGATEIMSTWIFKRSFVAYEMGYGSALSLIVCAMCVGVYFLFQWLQSTGKRKGVDL